MRVTKSQRIQVMRELRGFDKESHAKSLACGIIRSCNEESEFAAKVERANSVVAAVRENGVSSFFAAEYGKVFREPETAISTREMLIAYFVKENCLEKKHAAKMADCIIFSAAKRQDERLIQRLKAMCSRSLKAGFPFAVVADTAYYNAADVKAEEFIEKCVEICKSKNLHCPGSENIEALRQIIDALKEFE